MSGSFISSILTGYFISWCCASLHMIRHEQSASQLISHLQTVQIFMNGNEFTSPQPKPPNSTKICSNLRENHFSRGVAAPAPAPSYLFLLLCQTKAPAACQDLK